VVLSLNESRSSGQPHRQLGRPPTVGHAPKEDLQSSSAELVYCQPLRVPGEFLPDAAAPWSASHQIRPQEGANAFAPVPTHHCLPQSYIPKDLMSAGYVFIRHNGHRTPLQPPYDGPFRIMEAGPKNFVVDMGGKPERVAGDHLKPAHLDLDKPIDLAVPPRRGRPPCTGLWPGDSPSICPSPGPVPCACTCAC